MKPPSVYAVIGLPPGDYRTRPCPGGNYPVALRTWERIETWETDEWVFSVCFNDMNDEKVSFVWLEEAAPYPPGIVELARWRLGKLGAWLPRRPSAARDRRPQEGGKGRSTRGRARSLLGSRRRPLAPRQALSGVVS
jgi:hypothetical protein